MQSDRKLTGRLRTGVGGYGERQKGRITGGRKKFLEVMDVFVILIVNECILWSKLIKWYYIKLLGKGRRGFSTLWNKKRQNKKRCVGKKTQLKILGMENIHCIKKGRKERKNLTRWINSELDIVEERISELEESSEKFTRSITQKDKEGRI